MLCSPCRSELSVVRVGRTESMHSDCERITLDVLTRLKLDEIIRERQCAKSISLQDHCKKLTDRQTQLRIRRRLAIEQNNLEGVGYFRPQLYMARNSLKGHQQLLSM